MTTIPVPSVPVHELRDSAMCEAIRAADTNLLRFISGEPIRPRLVYGRIGTIMVWR